MANVNTLLDDHVTLRYESIDRLFLNGYVPRLQTPHGLARFLAGQDGEEIPRYAILGERTAAFNRALEHFAEAHEIPVIHFEKGDRKEAVAKPYLDRAEAAGREGVVLIGIAQERASVFRPPAVRERVPGRYGVRRTSADINHVYFYLWDATFGGAFVGRRLANLAALVEIGRSINRRLIELGRAAQRCTPAAATFEALVTPTGPACARVPGLRFGDPRVVALADFRWAAAAIRSRPLRKLVEHHLGSPYGPRQMAYDLSADHWPRPDPARPPSASEPAPVGLACL